MEKLMVITLALLWMMSAQPSYPNYQQRFIYADE
jgi:hypothetical protein